VCIPHALHKRSFAMVDRYTQRDVSLSVTTGAKRFKKFLRLVLGIAELLVKIARVIDAGLRWVHEWLADL
jgi:hypothetical protein